MLLDQELIRAVEEAVKQAGQPQTVASRIIKWLEGMGKGDMSPADMDEFLKTTLNSIKTQFTQGEV